MALALPRGTLAEKREGMEGVGGRRDMVMEEEEDGRKESERERERNSVSES